MAITDNNLTQEKWIYMTTTDEQIHRAIKRMKPWKATHSGTVPNTVFVHASDLLVPYLGPIFRATDSLETYLDDWKLTETPILKKPRKSDYTSTGVWRPIVLSNGYVRLLNSFKTEDLVSMCKKMGILPMNHFRGGDHRLDSFDGQNGQRCLEKRGGGFVALFGHKSGIPEHSY